MIEPGLETARVYPVIKGKKSTVNGSIHNITKRVCVEFHALH